MNRTGPQQMDPKADSLLTAGRASRQRNVGLWRDAWKRLLRNRLAVAGLVIIILLTFVAVFAPLIAPYDPRTSHLDNYNAPPSSNHIFGGDVLGRDIFSRLVYGARISLSVGILVQVVVVGIGLPIGVIAGMMGGKVDNILMRLIDILYAFPDLLLIILLNAILRESPITGGGGGLFVIFLAIGLVAWVGDARLVRGQVLSLKQREFVESARAVGAPQWRIMTRHLLPNSLSPVIVAVTFGIPRAIFAEAGLSYLGLGITPPTPSWGSMIQEGYTGISVYPHQVLFPGIAIAITMLAFTFLGDGLRDALDPRDRW